MNWNLSGGEVINLQKFFNGSSIFVIVHYHVFDTALILTSSAVLVRIHGCAAGWPGSILMAKAKLQDI